MNTVKYKRLTTSDMAQIVKLHTIKHMSLSEIATCIGISRMGVLKALRRMGIDTSKAAACHVASKCRHCGKSISMPRSRYKISPKLFCSRECYYAWVDSQNVAPRIVSRQGMRIARAMVSRYIQLHPGNVVHHVDRNNRNNRLDNLVVYRSNGDHVKSHRGIFIAPLFDGRIVASL